MSDTIIIIESPNKKDKIQKISGFDTYATKGHFKSLTKDFIVDYDNYEVEFDFLDDEAKKRMNFIFSQCVDKEVIIATDPDREGYAIGFLFYLVIKNKAKSIKRAEFHEITENGVKKGLENAIEFSKTNFKDFEAFKARAVGDKLVGFILSPKYANLLSDKNMSIGRVQTPALNLIVSKDEEIKAFEKLSEAERLSYKLKAKCKFKEIEFFIESEKILKDKSECDDFLSYLNDTKEAIFKSKDEKESKKAPALPFRTSKLQEKANSILGFAPNDTMKLAQELFENGLITYTRTDSNALSEEFINEVENAYKDKEWYERREYKAGKQSQAEAHEAIRITHVHEFSECESKVKEALADKFSDKHISLYKLIYQNSILSQAKDKINKISTFEFTIKGANFKINSTQTLFKGFEMVFEMPKDNDENEENIQSLDLGFLNDLNENQSVEILALQSVEIKKSAPSPYKESSFISLLEKEGIGRPSTYASFLPTLTKRQFVEIQSKGKNRFIIPTAKGLKLIESARANDEWITQSEFTKLMEGMLDAISKNELSYKDFIMPLHEKMNFAKVNENNKGASEKQIALVQKLCAEQNKEIPADLFDSFTKTKEFIDLLIKSAPTKPPSQKQQALAESLAQSNNLELPANYDKDYKICSAFIDKIFKSNKKGQNNAK